jgi:hypothetical protein
VISPSIRQLPHAGAPGRAYRHAGHETTIEHAFRVEPAECIAPRAERRSSESLANAAALRLGIAAQMLASHAAGERSPSVLPTGPATRGAARYASTAQGLGQTWSMGFSRTA